MNGMIQTIRFVPPGPQPGQACLLPVFLGYPWPSPKCQKSVPAAGVKVLRRVGACHPDSWNVWQKLFVTGPWVLDL